jgi:multiple sugar transport system substrate-binding protein
MKKFVLVMLVITLLLAACGQTAEETAPAASPTEQAAAPTKPQAASPSAVPTEPPPPQEQTTIRFAISDFEQPLYQDMIDAFEKENPDLHIEIVSINEVLELGPLGQMEVPDDADQRLVAAADVVNMGVSRQAVEQGLVRDLTPFLDADPNFQADDFYSDALGAYQWAGGTWSMPTTLNYRLVFFDKDLFDQAGVDYPEAGWTWDDLLAKAQALTVREGDDVAQWGFVPNGPAYRLVESQVGYLADYEADPPLPRFDDENVIAAVDWSADLYLKEQVMPYFDPEDEDDSPLTSSEQVLIDGGQAAIWFDQDIMWWVRGQQANVGVVPFPAGGDWGLNPVSVGGMVMSAGTSQPEAAWRWLDFVSRQPLGALALGIRFMPARRSTAEASGFWDDLDDELATTLRSAAENSYVNRQAVAYDDFDAAWHAVMRGEKSAAEALVDSQKQAEATILGKEAEGAGATPAPTFVVAAPEETPVSEGAVAIAFAPGLGSLNLEPFRDLADQFNAEHPDIVVDVQMANLLSGTPNLASMAGAADCFEWYPSFQKAEDREAILNLSPFVDADPAFTTDDYFGQALEQFTWQGQLMGLPADVTPYVIEYNKDLFDAAGRAYPDPGWTWDEFLALAVDLTQGEDEAKQYGFVPEYYELNDLLVITERLGAKLIDEGADPPAFTLNDPATVEAMQWYAGLTTQHGVKPVLVTDLNRLLAEANTKMVEREALINDGRAAMWTGSASAAMVFGEREGLNIGYAPLPVRADGTSSSGILTTSGYFISADTENRQACWQWITFLSGQPAAVQGLPARQSVAGSDEFRQAVGADKADAYLASIGDSGQPSSFQLFAEEAWLGGAIYWYGQAFGQVIEGKATAQEALDAAQAMADDYRACVIAGGDYSQAAWEACVQEIDPTLPSFLFTAGQ